MNLTIPRAALLPALTRAAQVADSKSTMPILACALLRADGKRLTVAGSDLNLHAATTLAAPGKPGAICLDAKRLAATIGGLADGDVTLTVDGTTLAIKAGRSLTRLVGMTATDYPKLPSDAAVTYAAVSGPDVAALLDRTLPSACTDETRFHLNGVMLDARTDTATMVATDGHRLAKAARAMAAIGPGAAGVIIPRAGANALLKLCRDATAVEWGIGASPRHLFARVDKAVLAIKLIDALFPPWQQVVPASARTTVTVDRLGLLAAVKRCGLLASDTRGLTLTVDPDADDPLILASDNPDAGDVREGVEADVTGPAVTSGCNPAYLRDALTTSAADRVVIGLGGPLDPWAVRGEGDAQDVAVIMPMRVA